MLHRLLNLICILLVSVNIELIGIVDGIKLLQTVKGVAEAAPVSETDWDERLLVHICYSPRRYIFLSIN